MGEEVYNDLVLSFDEFELLRVTVGHCGQTLKTNSRGLSPLGESGGRMGEDSRHGSYGSPMLPPLSPIGGKLPRPNMCDFTNKDESF